MLDEMLFKYILNWIFCSVLVFLIFYFIFYALVVKRNKFGKVIKIFCVFLFLFLSFFGCGFLKFRTYRYYKIDGKYINNYSFVIKAIQDYEDNEIIKIYSSDVKVERHAANPGTRRHKKVRSKKKITYLNIDNGKYVIPIDEDEIKVYTLVFSQEYVIYMHKNTKLIESISMREKEI